MQQSLLQFRNNVSIAYFMLNALYVLALFTLQLHKDSLYIVWPVGGTSRIIYIVESKVSFDSARAPARARLRESEQIYSAKVLK